jgi:hypothetical protein
LEFHDVGRQRLLRGCLRVGVKFYSI